MRFSKKNDNEDSCVIMSEIDVINGVGSMEEMVDLEMFYQENVYQDTKSESPFEIIHYWKGVCDMCGYDRGIHSTHTEIDAATVECDNCNAIIFRKE